MRFWDASAIVPLVVEEARTARLRALGQADPVLVVWWSTEVECVSAILRLEREQQLSSGQSATAIAHLADLREAWQEVQPVDPVRETACRLLRVHSLRAADALQLAAALAVCDHRPARLPFVCLDDRLAEAAQREGFRLLA